MHLSKQLVVRVTGNTERLVRSISKDRGEDISSFVRRAILKELAELSFLSVEQKKALGLKKRDPEQTRKLGRV